MRRGEDDLPAELLALRLLVALDDDVAREEADLGAVLRDHFHAFFVEVAVAQVVEVEPLRERHGVAAVEDLLDVALLGLEGVEARRRHEDLISRGPIDGVLQVQRVVEREDTFGEARPGPSG